MFRRWQEKKLRKIAWRVSSHLNQESWYSHQKKLYKTKRWHVQYINNIKKLQKITNTIQKKSHIDAIYRIVKAYTESYNLTKINVQKKNQRNKT